MLKTGFNTRAVRNPFKLGQLHAFIFAPKPTALQGDKESLQKALKKLFTHDIAYQRAYPFPYIDELESAGKDTVKETFNYTGKEVKVKEGTQGFKFTYTQGFGVHKALVNLEEHADAYALFLVNKAGALLGAKGEDGVLRGFEIVSFTTEKIQLYTGQAVEKFSATVEIEGGEFNRNLTWVEGVFPNLNEIEGLADLTLHALSPFVFDSTKNTSGTDADPCARFDAAVYWEGQNMYEIIKEAYKNNSTNPTGIKLSLLTFTDVATGESLQATKVIANDARKVFVFELSKPQTNKLSPKAGMVLRVSFESVSELGKLGLANFEGIGTEVKVVAKTEYEKSKTESAK